MWRVLSPRAVALCRHRPSSALLPSARLHAPFAHHAAATAASASRILHTPAGLSSRISQRVSNNSCAPLFARSSLSSPSPYFIAAQQRAQQLHLHAAAQKAAPSADASATTPLPASSASSPSIPRPVRVTLKTLPYDVRNFLRSLVPEPVSQLGLLVKAELTLVVTMSSAFGFMLAGSAAFDWPHIFANFLGTIACASAAAIGNQVMEMRYDAMMPRTKNRPLVTGYFRPKPALALASVFTVGGAAMLHYAAAGDLVAPALGVGTIFLYTQVYTRLKRHHRWNTEVGAIVGAVPVLIGWSCAVANWSHHMQMHHHLAAPVSTLQSLLMPHAVYGFAFLAAWQMQHFMTIAFKEEESYAGAGYHMMRGNRALHKGIAWVGFLSVMPFLAPVFGVTSAMFPWTATAINSYLGVFYYRWWKAMQGTDPIAKQKAARSCMLHGIIYFFLMFAAIVAHAQDNNYHLVRNFMPPHLIQAAMAFCTHPPVAAELERQRAAAATPAVAAPAVAQIAGATTDDGCIPPTVSQLSEAHMIGHQPHPESCVYLQVLNHFNGQQQPAATPASSPAAAATKSQ